MKATDVLQLIAERKELTYFRDPSKAEFYAVSEKQFQWAWGVLACEWTNLDSRFGATVTDDNGNSWGLSWDSYRWNMPHYIPNYKKYGRTFYIHFSKSESLKKE